MNTTGRRTAFAEWLTSGRQSSVGTPSTAGRRFAKWPLQRLDAETLRRLPGERDLEARIAGYELAAQMQTAAAEALDISGESETTKKLYGIDFNELHYWHDGQERSLTDGRECRVVEEILA